MENKVLVPVDFSEVADISIRSAVAFCKTLDATLYLLHIINKPTMYIGKNKVYDNQLIEESTVNKLQEIADDIETDHQVRVEIIAVPGTIFETIHMVCNEIKATWVFMGTHGVKGFQHIRGSNVLRILNHAIVPFVLTQRKTEIHPQIKDVVLPVNVPLQSNEKTPFAIYLAQHFSCRFHIIYPTETDSYLVRKVNYNLFHTKQSFEKEDIEYTVKQIDKDNSYLADAVIDYAEQINADMIMIMIYPEKGIGEFFIKPEQQKIIENQPRIPVMCINTGTILG